MHLEFHQLELRYKALRVRQRGRDSRLLAALDEQGQQSPVLVVAGSEARQYVLIDGYRRVWACSVWGRTWWLRWSFRTPRPRR